MMQRIIYKLKTGLALGLCAVMLLSSMGNYAFGQTTQSAPVAVSSTIEDTEELRSVWLSYYELDSLLKGKSEAAFRAGFEEVISRLKKDGFNGVMVQVRPFGDALYASKVYPSSYLISGKEGDKLTFDPLTIMVEISKRNNINIQAWINPYRVRINSIKAPISDSSMAAKWLKEGKGKVVKLSTGIYFNPSDPSVNELVKKGVEEIINNYAVDGIHFDDYFYPTTAASFDKLQYEAYQKAGGKLKLADFRRNRIDAMVKGVYDICKKVKRPVSFGISPQGIMKNNYDGQFANVEKWMKEPGYIDYICPQIYYGYQNSTAPYDKILTQWQNLAKNSHVDLYIGLAPYKIGLSDEWAKAGKLEWIQEKGILKQMVMDARESPRYKGIVFFRYDSLYKPSKTVESRVNEEKAWVISLWLKDN